MSGPIVIEIPPAGADGSLNANIVNIWQQPLEDAGLLGVDKGKGVKLLMLPPGYSEQDPRRLCRAAAGHVRQLRAVPLEPRRATATPTSRSPSPMASGSRSIRCRRPSNPPPTVFTDVKDVLFDSTIRYDESFFEGLNRIVQSEPWLERDRAMIDQLQIARHREGQAVRSRCARRSRLSTPASAKRSMARGEI